MDLMELYAARAYVNKITGGHTAGTPGGAALLDENSKIPIEYIPSEYDDYEVGYYDGTNFYKNRSGEPGSYIYTDMITPETGKLYGDIGSNRLYMYLGSSYVSVSGDGAPEYCAEFIMGESSSVTPVSDTVYSDVADAVATKKTVYARIYYDNTKSGYIEIPYVLKGTEGLETSYNFGGIVKRNQYYDAHILIISQSATEYASSTLADESMIAQTISHGTAMFAKVPSVEAVATALDGKQDELTAGTNVTISGGVISSNQDTAKNPYSLTFGSDSYDGSAAKEITAASLGLGTVFTLKGSVDRYSLLPSTGNTTGDVWYVVNDDTISGETYLGKVGYIWLDDGTGYRWEQLGLPVDLDGYVTQTQMTTALSAKQNTIDSSHKISSDNVDDTSATNKFVTAAEKTAWNAKENKHIIIDASPANPEFSVANVTRNGVAITTSEILELISDGYVLILRVNTGTGIYILGGVQNYESDYIIFNAFTTSPLTGNIALVQAAMHNTSGSTANIVFEEIENVPTSWSSISDKPTFATVATSGNYNDLSNKPSNVVTGTGSAYKISVVSTLPSDASSHTDTIYLVTG